ncbi:hypothetical protein C8P66_12227 [Humitalea rosea]|uniref:UrcA family protein n=1 Tax=Humitalea rosea TaxID=990373 RepID=A0A2W7K036_9PROT|nr:hypothetical protein [Humitalea rosea]PZW41040.1 hypothetical protein C8P66_12227 [Humitalea rosea]
MTPPMNLVLLAAALLLLAPPLRAGAAAQGQPQPLRVTTDSAEYCDVLARRIAAAPEAGSEPAFTLAEEGRRLCEAGHIRTGIARLRRALRAATPGVTPGH